MRGTAARCDHAQLIAQAAMPAVWALYVELLRSGAATLTRRERHDAEHPALALLLAPVPVLTAWRRGILTHATTPQTREPKMSAALGHFPGADQREDSKADTEEDGTEIFPTPIAPIPEQSVPHLPAAFYSGEAAADMRAAADTAVDESQRIGRGRGLSSRHAVLDLARCHPVLTGAQIAGRLNLSRRTVRRHLGRR